MRFSPELTDAESIGEKQWKPGKVFSREEKRAGASAPPDLLLNLRNAVERDVDQPVFPAKIG